ncbi:MAG TPA: hypothetical protein VFF33_10275 [Ignavibacteriaceae bacterium]|nr:hypothetical protein [Ignavibacteriaceae bacterium]
MKYFFICVLLFPFTTYGQFNQIHQRLSFADYLFCSRDYLRAAEEFDKILPEIHNDTIFIKIGLSYYNIKDYPNSIKYFSMVKDEPDLSSYANEKIMVSYFLNKEYKLIKFYNPTSRGIMKLFNYSLLIRNYPPDKSIFLRPFDEEEKIEAQRFYNLKINPPTKSSTLAAIMSAIIPGAGKIYTNRISDGITSLIATSLLGYLTYTNYKADHKARTYIFAGLTGFFYAGNIYGSFLSAKVYNQKISEDFNLNLNIYLEGKNYFVTEPKFCK